MDFSIKTFDTKNTINAAKTGCIAVGVFENKKLGENNYLIRAIESHCCGFQGKHRPKRSLPYLADFTIKLA